MAGARALRLARQPPGSLVLPLVETKSLKLFF